MARKYSAICHGGEKYIFCLRAGIDVDKILSAHVWFWGYGGMVDAEDLKSFGHCDRVGSSPTIPTKYSHAAFSGD